MKFKNRIIAIFLLIGIIISGFELTTNAAIEIEMTAGDKNDEIYLFYNLEDGVDGMGILNNPQINMGLYNKYKFILPEGIYKSIRIDPIYNGPEMIYLKSINLVQNNKSIDLIKNNLTTFQMEQIESKDSGILEFLVDKDSNDPMFLFENIAQFEVKNKIKLNIFKVLTEIIVLGTMLYIVKQKFFTKKYKVFDSNDDKYNGLFFTILNLIIYNLVLKNIISNFTKFEDIIMIIIITISSLLFPKLYRYINIKISKNKLINNMVLVAITVYLTFASIGNYMFLYPLDIKIEVWDILQFCIILSLFLSYTVSIVSLYYRICDNVDLNMNKKTNYIIIRIGCFVAVIVIGIVFLIAYNPAITTRDTLDQFIQAKTGNISNWHTPFHTLIIKLLISIYDSPSFVAIVQIIFYAFVISSGITFIYELGLGIKWVILTLFIITLSPSISIHLVAIWKDIPYSASLLWVTIIIARISIIPEKYVNLKSINVQLIIGLTFICLLRQNGIIPYILCSLGIFIVFRKNKRLILSVIISLMAIMIILGPIYSFIDVKPGPIGGKYIGLGQDILGVYYSDGKLSNEAISIVEILSNVEGYNYSPYRANTSYNLDVPVGKFIKIYIETFINNPIIMTRAFLCRMDLAWNIFPAKNFGDWLGGTSDIVASVHLAHPNYTMDGYGLWDNLNYPKRKNNILTNIIEGITLITYKQPLFSILYRPGIYTLSTIICIIMNFLKSKKSRIVIFLPFIGQILSLALSTGWNDFRYFAPLISMSIFLFMTTILDNRNEKNINL